MNHHHEEDDEWWNDCEENAVHQFSSMPSENDGNTTDLRRWWYNCEEHDERWWWHDDMTTWWHNNKIFIMKDDGFMMTWWQTWLEGKTRWPLVDWGAVRDSVLEEDRCCAKRYLASSMNLKYLYISRCFKLRENMAVKQKFHWLCIFTSCECILMYAFPYSRGRFL